MKKIVLCDIKFIKTCALIGLLMFVALFVCGCSPSNYEATLKTPVIQKPDILQNGVLKVGVDYGNPPLAGETSKASGIDIDVASAIGDELGLRVEFIDVGTSPELAIANKKVDIVMGLSKATNSEDILRSDPYIKTACALFAMDANAKVPVREGNDKFSTQMGSSSAFALQAQFDSKNMKLENNISSSFEALANGSVKYVAADAVIGSYVAKTSDMNANIIALITKPSGYCIGVNKQNENLYKKIQGVLETLNKGGILSLIENKWIGKSLNIDKITLTPEAGNQADAGEIDAGVYQQTDPEAPKDPTNW